MKNFITQSLTLTMMIALICARHIQRRNANHRCNTNVPDCLEFICENVTATLKIPKPWFNHTIRVPSETNPMCAKEFFCLAEKSLENHELTHHHQKPLERLLRLLKAYNKQQPTNCKLSSDGVYNITGFLKDVKNCSC